MKKEATTNNNATTVTKKLTSRDFMLDISSKIKNTKKLTARCYTTEDIVEVVNSEARKNNLFAITANRYNDTKNSIVAKSTELIDKTNDFSVYELKKTSKGIELLTTDTMYADIVATLDSKKIAHVDSYKKSWNLKNIILVSDTALALDLINIANASYNKLIKEKASKEASKEA